MKRIKLDKITVIIAVSVIILGIAAALVVASRSARTTSVAPTPVATPVKGNTTHDEPTPKLSPRPSGSAATPTPAVPSPTPAATVSKPTLQKSSGNAAGSNVPGGATIEFTCEGTANAQCEVALTDQANPARVINLGAKTIASNGRDEYFAVWQWTAVSGQWNIVAKSNNGGTAVSSDVDTLVVRP